MVWNAAFRLKSCPSGVLPDYPPNDDALTSPKLDLCSKFDRRPGVDHEAARRNIENAGIAPRTAMAQPHGKNDARSKFARSVVGCLIRRRHLRGLLASWRIRLLKNHSKMETPFFLIWRCGGEGGIALAKFIMEKLPANAAESASNAFVKWSSLGPSERRALLNRAAAEVERRSDQFVELMGEELRAGEPWGRFNVLLACGMIREAAALTTQIVGEIIPSDKPGLISLALREPVGTVLGIAPWNAPVILGCRAISTPLACGNTVILKASERCPKTHALIVEAFVSAGFPDGVVNLVTNAPKDASDVVSQLIAHPAVRRINFTGSTRVGRIIARHAAEVLKPVLLELGGKAPLLVLEDADLDEAVNAATFGAFMNAGQICMSTERLIAVDSIADQFVAKLSEKISALPAAAIGFQVDDDAETAAAALIDDAIAKGADVVARGSATILDRITPEMRFYHEESFGPLLGIVRVRDEAEAIRTANDTEYGLSAAVFTRDSARGLKVARQIRSGICHVNGPTVQDEPQMPFGGVGASGYGRFGGRAGIEAFTELRWITIASEPGHYPF